MPTAPDPKRAKRNRTDVRIIRPRHREVNAARTVILLVLGLAMLAATGCGGDEARAERMYEEAMTAVDEKRLEDAVSILEEIVRKYPATTAGERSRDDVVLYRGLAGAVSRYPVDEAKRIMVETARALERYRARKRRLPARLSDLVPDWLDETPIDPWGNTLEYGTNNRNRRYTLTCLGADGLPGGSGPDGDIKVENGEFVRAGGGS